jgi:hypothetical protein
MCTSNLDNAIVFSSIGMQKDQSDAQTKCECWLVTKATLWVPLKTTTVYAKEDTKLGIIQG